MLGLFPPPERIVPQVHHQAMGLYHRDATTRFDSGPHGGGISRPEQMEVAAGRRHRSQRDGKAAQLALIGDVDVQVYILGVNVGSPESRTRVQSRSPPHLHTGVELFEPPACGPDGSHQVHPGMSGPMAPLCPRQEQPLLVRNCDLRWGSRTRMGVYDRPKPSQLPACATHRRWRNTRHPRQLSRGPRATSLFHQEGMNDLLGGGGELPGLGEHLRLESSPIH